MGELTQETEFEKIYFDDIKNVKWAEESIKELTERNIISKDSIH